MKTYKIFFVALFAILVLAGGACCRDGVDESSYVSPDVYNEQEQLRKQYENRSEADQVAQITGGLYGAVEMTRVTITYVKNTEILDTSAVSENVVFNPNTEEFTHPIADLAPGTYEYNITLEYNDGITNTFQSGEMIFPEDGSPPTVSRDDEVKIINLVPTDIVAPADTIVMPDPIPPVITPPPTETEPVVDTNPPLDDETTVPDPTPDPDPVDEGSEPIETPISWVCCIDNSVPEVDDRNYMALEWAGCEGGIEVPWSPTCDEFNNSR